MNVALMKEGEDVDVEVSWADQQNINRFSRLNAQFSEAEETYEKAKKEAEFLEDSVTELESVLDEDEAIPYRVGDAFVHLSFDKAKELVERDQATAKKRVLDLKAELDRLDMEMDRLKKDLYAKFGNTINLERTD
jgi:prefoldin subunit 4